MQHCPICQTKVTPKPRYPRCVYAVCASRASSADGRLLEFFNADASGGFVARYKDTLEDYPSHECWIDGVHCHADEAHLGGIVIEVV